MESVQNVPLGALGVVRASHSDVAWAWAGLFALAIATLVLVYFVFPNTKRLIFGKDGRISTSKFQPVMWTAVVFFALLSLFYGFAVMRLLVDLLGVDGMEALKEPLSDGFETFLSDGLDETYLLLLGFPLAGAIAARTITATKVANGSVDKAKKDDDSETSGVQELVGDDNGEPDLGDFQYLLFNLLAVGYFLVQFVAQPSEALPSMPDTLVGLTGVAAAAYVTKKGVYSEPPILFGVLPPSAKPGAEVKVYGQRLISKAAKVAKGRGARATNAELGTVVVFNGLAAKLKDGATEASITAEVPEMDKGPVMLKVIRPPGASSEELPFTVLDK